MADPRSRLEFAVRLHRHVYSKGLADLSNIRVLSVAEAGEVEMNGGFPSKAHCRMAAEEPQKGHDACEPCPWCPSRPLWNPVANHWGGNTRCVCPVSPRRGAHGSALAAASVALIVHNVFEVPLLSRSMG